ncbi:MAG TPA: hypothetical protein VFU76_17500 [Terriglobales bacterium]|nr:hypothetical protein [Terriglobales bacterium]
MNFRFSWECSGGGGFEPLHECGDIVERSGLYEVLHGDQRSESVVLVHGQKFPACACCAHAVRYRLLRAAPYIFEDEDFLEG